MPKDEVVATSCRLVLGAVFVIAGLSKIWSPEGAAGFVAYWLPEQIDAASYIVVIVVAAVEFGIGLLLLGGVWPKQILCVTFGMIALLSTLLIVSHIRGDAPSCGCFGAAGAHLLDQSPWVAHLRNLALLGLCGTAAFANRGSQLRAEQLMESEHVPA